MHDLVGIIRAPKDLQKHLLRRGGTNVFGESIYRLVWAAAHLHKRGGRWHEWDPNIPVNERNGVHWKFDTRGVLTPFMHKPLRIIEEVRETRKYAFEGWVIERWMPASYYGSQEAWENRVLHGTTIPLLGPYPAEGEYELVAGGEDDKRLPTTGQMDNALAECERLRNRWTGSVAQAIKNRVQEAEYEYQKSVARQDEALRLQLLEGRKILMSTSLEGGRIRNELAARAGIREHVGN